MNGIPVCSITVNPTNPIFFNGKGLNRGQVIFMTSEDRQTNEPFLYTNQGTDVHMLTGSTVLSLFISNSQSQCLTADPGVASSIPARYHTFVEIDHETISTVILLPSADLFKKGCCQLQAKVCAQITG